MVWKLEPHRIIIIRPQINVKQRKKSISARKSYGITRRTALLVLVVATILIPYCYFISGLFRYVISRNIFPRALDLQVASSAEFVILGRLYSQSV